jgi:hypothetical protein
MTHGVADRDAVGDECRSVTRHPELAKSVHQVHRLAADTLGLGQGAPTGEDRRQRRVGCIDDA